MQSHIAFSFLSNSYSSPQNRSLMSFTKSMLLAFISILHTPRRRSLMIFRWMWDQVALQKCQMSAYPFRTFLEAFSCSLELILPFRLFCVLFRCHVNFTFFFETVRSVCRGLEQQKEKNLCLRGAGGESNKRTFRMFEQWQHSRKEN